MYWFWFLLFASQPMFGFLGLLDVFGDEAKKAAEDMFVIYGIAIILIMILVAIYIVASLFI